MGQACFTGDRTTLAAAAIASQLFDPVLPAAALTGAFGELVRDNTPTRPVRAPLLVAQGGADSLVTPAMQDRWVAGRCAAGQRLQYLTYPGRNHVSLVAADSPLTGELVRWALARLAGQPAASTC